MSKIATSIEETKELVNSMLVEGQDAYLDWGENSTMYQNVSCKYFADEVAREFQLQGYFVYYELMGYGSSRVPQGTPVCIRIRKTARDCNSSVVPFS